MVRIDEVGRATPLDYGAFNYRPQCEVELRYSFAQFVRFHFGRMVASVKEGFGNSLYFLDSKLSQALITEEHQSQSLAKFLREGTEETDIVIRNIALQDLRTVPMKATVDFEKVFYSRADHQELRRERCVVGEGILPNSSCETWRCQMALSWLTPSGLRLRISALMRLSADVYGSKRIGIVVDYLRGSRWPCAARVLVSSTPLETDLDRIQHVAGSFLYSVDPKSVRRGLWIDAKARPEGHGGQTRAFRKATPGKHDHF